LKLSNINNLGRNERMLRESTGRIDENFPESLELAADTPVYSV